MVIYITVLRAFAAILITNSHYSSIYPISSIASGGLLGDVIFFAVSGFCLSNPKESFFYWYIKRLLRIYPSVWIITSVYILLGFFTFEKWTIFKYLIFPTNFHFIASIILLYIPFYIVAKSSLLKKNVLFIFGFVLFVQMIYYFFFYNKTFYHIDEVMEPMIRFLFFESMLLGLYFRNQFQKFKQVIDWKNWIFLFTLLLLYLTTKIMFNKFHQISYIQIFNQYILLLLLFFVFKCFAGINRVLENMNKSLLRIIQFISNITLEIYLVQIVIIHRFNYFIFPLNFILITCSIIIIAFLLHLLSNNFSLFFLTRFRKGKLVKSEY